MGINTVGNILCRVAQYFLDGELVGALVIQQGRAGVPAFMRLMLAPCGGHNFFEQLQEGFSEHPKWKELLENMSFSLILMMC